MSRFLYGSSNVYRHFAKSTIGKDLGLTLVQCTKKTVFDAHVASIGTLPSGSLVVSSVLENFVSDHCRDLDQAEVGLFAKQLITAHVEVLAALVRDSPDSFVVISPLLSRSSPGKMHARFQHEKWKEKEIKCYVRRHFKTKI